MVERLARRGWGVGGNERIDGWGAACGPVRAAWLTEDGPAAAGKPVTKNIFPFQYAFNLFSHNSPMTENGYNEEEMKMVSGAGGRAGRWVGG